MIKHLAMFIFRLWQIHVFEEEKRNIHERKRTIRIMELNINSPAYFNQHYGIDDNGQCAIITIHMDFNKYYEAAGDEKDLEKVPHQEGTKCNSVKQQSYQ